MHTEYQRSYIQKVVGTFRKIRANRNVNDLVNFKIFKNLETKTEVIKGAHIIKEFRGLIAQVGVKRLNGFSSQGVVEPTSLRAQTLGIKNLGSAVLQPMDISAQVSKSIVILGSMHLIDQGSGIFGSYVSYRRLFCPGILDTVA